MAVTGSLLYQFDNILAFDVLCASLGWEDKYSLYQYIWSFNDDLTKTCSGYQALEVLFRNTSNTEENFEWINTQLKSLFKLMDLNNMKENQLGLASLILSMNSVKIECPSLEHWIRKFRGSLPKKFLLKHEYPNSAFTLCL